MEIALPDSFNQIFWQEELGIIQNCMIILYSFTIINKHFTFIKKLVTIINEPFTINSLKKTIIRSFDHYWEAEPTALINKLLLLCNMYTQLLRPLDLGLSQWNMLADLSSF